MASIVYQDYGTSILLFVKGASEEDAYGKYLSLYNWGATSTDLNWAAPNTIACWSTAAKFVKYLTRLHINRIEDNRPRGMTDKEVREKAAQLAQAEFETIERESFRSVNSEITPFTMGEITAEKPDTDFADAVLSHAFAYRE